MEKRMNPATIKKNLVLAALCGTACEMLKSSVEHKIKKGAARDYWF